MRSLVFAAVLLFATPALAAPQVTIAQGALGGANADGVDSYKNIPYVAPPVGALRWAAPAPSPHWTGTRDATAFGPVCPQHVTEGLVKRANLPQSEDCLSLNIWTPAGRKGAKLPVMVWIYGGGFTQGGASVPLYDGTQLASHGVVLVSFNYRLGRLGFFPHPALGGEANFGVLDQIAALRWVRDNIAAFGGDPDNVTIFGESAGGVSVDLLMASPLAKGLFAKAIAESGGLFDPMPTAAVAAKGALAFAGRLGASDLAALRAASVDQVLKADDDDDGPVIDGRSVLEDPRDAFAAGRQAAIPYLTGANSNEGAMVADGAWLLKPLGARIDDFRKLYGTTGDLELAQQLFNDRFFSGPTAALAAAASRRAPAYVYNFGFLNARAHLRGETGVPHGGEMPFVFGFGALAAYAPQNDLAAVAMIQGYWINFAKTGDPNGAGLPPWPKFAGAAPQTLVIGDETRSVADFRKARFDAAAKLSVQHVD